MRLGFATPRSLPAALLLGAGVLCLFSEPVRAAEGDGKGVTVKTHGAGDAYAGESAEAPAEALPPLDNQVVRSLTIQTSLPNTAPEAARKLRAYIAQKQDPQVETFLRRLLVRALLTSEAPSGEIIEEADRTAPGLPQSGSIRALFYLEVSQALLRRGEGTKQAVAYAQQARKEIPPTETRPEVVAYANGILGQALLANGECRPAIETLDLAVATSADSQTVLGTLGAAYEACGEPKRAIDYYVRALGVYGSDDSSYAEPLRRLYSAQNGSLEGLDDRIRRAWDHSMRQQVFDARRYEAAMPEWTMENTAGETVRSADLAGKVLVLDFWGSWCGPCRMELPHFQAMYEKYRDRGVVFYGVNWERADRSQRKATALAYLQQNGFDFPNVYDLDDSAPRNFRVDSFPTVFLVDHTGKIRYRNVGFSDAISEIMTLQIESLLDEQKQAGAKKK